MALFSASRQAELQRVFNEIDKDGSKSLDASEFVLAAKAAGQTISLSQAQQLIANCDSDGSGKLEFGEFLTVMANLTLGKKTDTGSTQPVSFVDLFSKGTANVVGHSAVVGIDFGTAQSGFAYATPTNPEQITPSIWSNSTAAKTSTVILIDKSSKKCVGFGDEAYSKYIEMDEKQQASHYLFEKFKMQLYGDLSADPNVKSASGESLPASTVFGQGLLFLKNLALKTMTEAGIQTGENGSNIRWVITVPAIWSEGAKGIMRKAANIAGLGQGANASHLLLALEPEAASLTCREENLNLGFSAGDTYMILDAGGGTFDMAVHEVCNGLKTVKEIKKASGGKWGSTYVDLEFEKSLKEILFNAGPSSLIDNFKKKFPDAWLRITKEFEKQKIKTKPDENESHRFPTGPEFPNYIKETTEKSFKEIIDGIDGQSSSIDFSAMKQQLVISHEKMLEFFKNIVDQIIQHVNSIYNETKPACRYIFCVGGFSESEVLFSAIQEHFGARVKVMRPKRASAAIVTGAVRFGLNPGVISERIAKKTYGIESCTTWIESTHGSNSKCTKVNRGGKVFCDNIFTTFVNAGEKIDIGHTETQDFYPVYDEQRSITFTVFCCNNANPHYTNDPTCKQLATCTVPIPDIKETSDRKIQVKMAFGLTEIVVEVIDPRTKEIKMMNLDFTSH